VDTSAIKSKSVMNNTPSVSEIFKSIISITDLNKGKGSKIIDALKKTGYAVILKNNQPEAVLITPEQFEEYWELKEEIKDLTLGIEALRRISHFNPEASISHENMIAEFGISQTELDDIDVEID